MKEYRMKITFDGETKTVREWAHELGLRPDTLWYRVYRGWSLKRVFAEQLHEKKRGVEERDKLPDMRDKWKEWAQYEGVKPKPRPKDLQV